MKIFNFLATAASVLLFAADSHALKIDPAAIENPNVFGIVFPNKTEFYGRADKVVSISKQEFIAGPLFVTEVCIELDQSPLQLRIYHSSALPIDKTSEAIQKQLPEKYRQYATPPESIKKMLRENIQDANVQKSIYKDYPTTTHARTLEFIVTDLDELNEFFRKISDHFMNKAKEKINRKTYTLEGK